MVDGQDEMLVDDDVGRIAAIGVGALARHMAVIGLGEAVQAILLEILVAMVAMTAAVDHAADADDLADLGLGDLRSDLGDPADDFVAGDAGKGDARPFAAGAVQIGMADPAIEDVEGDVLRPGFPAVDRPGREFRVGGLRGVSFDLHRSLPRFR